MMEQISSLFKYLLSSNTVNFLLMVLFLYWVVRKINLGNILSNGIVKVKDELFNSNKVIDDAGKDYIDAQKDVDNLPNILKSISDETMSGAKVVCENYQNEANKSVVSIKNNISVAIADEERKISSLLTRQALEKSLQDAKEDISSKLLNNANLQSKFIEQSLKEFEGLSL